MVSDRLSKEELKEDRVVTAATQAADYVRRNARFALAAVALLIVAVVGGLLWSQARVRAEREASLTLLQGQGAYANGDFAGAAHQFETVANRWGSTRSARLARLFLGNSQLAQGNSAAAEQSFRKFLGSAQDPVSEAGAHRGLAAALLAQQKLAEAAEEFSRAAAVEQNPLAPEDWLQAGLAWTRAQDPTKASEAFRTLLEKHPRSSSANEARIRLREAEARSGS